MNEELKNQIRNATDVLREVASQPQPTLGIDLDGCVEPRPKVLAWGGRGGIGDTVTEVARLDGPAAQAAQGCEVEQEGRGCEGGPRAAAQGIRATSPGCPAGQPP